MQGILSHRFVHIKVCLHVASTNTSYLPFAFKWDQDQFFASSPLTRLTDTLTSRVNSALQFHVFGTLWKPCITMLFWSFGIHTFINNLFLFFSNFLWKSALLEGWHSKPILLSHRVKRPPLLNQADRYLNFYSFMCKSKPFQCLTTCHFRPFFNAIQSGLTKQVLLYLNNSCSLHSES